jgi:3-oxoacyl-[acyl-carrier protein] reductase
VSSPGPQGSALVTGASRGIGAAVAHVLAAQGWPVGVGFRERAEDAAEVVEGIVGAGGRAVALPADICEPEAAEELIQALESRHGPVLVLVNNAGIRQDGLAAQLSDDEWQRVLETNLSAAFRLTRRALGAMIRARFGRVVNVASVAGLRASPGQANYAASKAGLLAMTRTVAVEVARRGVTVNALAPGYVETEMIETVDEGALDLVPARRAGTAEEVAACVRFLASAEASYVTGACLTVDGGLTA